MLDFYFIGTSGKVPQLHRRLTSAMLRAEGDITLIDAGEGTQLGISKSGWSAKSISTILITHLHADHVLGLAGVLLQIHNSGRTDRIIIAGPKGVKRYVNSLYLVLPTLKYPIYFIELTGDSDFILANTLEIDAFKLNHSVSCYGYSFYFRHFGKFNVEKAKTVPKRSWGELSKGFATRDFNGVKVKNDQILGPERKGIKVTYVTDTRPTESIVEYAAYSDLFVCEGMYIGSGETEERDNINKIKNYHMTFLEAATLAKHAHVSKLMLTHFNPSLQYPSSHLSDARKFSQRPMQLQIIYCLTSLLKVIYLLILIYAIQQWSKVLSQKQIHTLIIYALKIVIHVKLEKMEQRERKQHKIGTGVERRN